MGFDGGGYKAFWNDFCKSYSDYVLYGKSPVGFSTGSRNYNRIYKDMEPDFAKKAKKQLVAYIYMYSKNIAEIFGEKELFGYV